MAWAALTPLALAAESKITEVTVYADRAEVVREAEVRLAPGDNAVSFTGLPWRTDRKSLRADARGVAASLGAIELAEVVAESKKSPEWAAADKEVKKLESQIAALDAQAAVSGQLADYLAALKASSAQRAAEDTAEGKVDIESIRQTYDFIRKALGEISREDLARKVKRAELKEKLVLAKAKRRAAGQKGNIRSLTATVHVAAKSPGALKLRLKYVAGGASWEPVYRMGFDSDHNQVQLTSEALVKQTTGEPWSGVKLNLSTSSPASSLATPWLTARRLAPIRPMAKTARGKAAAAQEIVIEEDQLGRTEPSLQNVAPDLVGQFSHIVTSAVGSAGYDVTFSVPGTVDLPEDGSPRQVVLRSDELDGTFSYRVVPELRQAAYLVAAAKAPTDYPLLPGVARIYAGSAYLGESQIKAHAPGEDLILSFGEDKRVKVERIRLPAKKGSAGFAGKYRVYRRAFRTTVENRTGATASLALEERIPISEDERIKVTVTDETTPRWEEIPDRPGILKWSLQLAPGERRAVEIHYEVRVPKDLSIRF